MISNERLERLARWYAASGAEQGFDTSTGCECPDSPHCNVLHDLAMDVGRLIDDVRRCHDALDRIHEVARDSLQPATDTTARAAMKILSVHGVVNRPSEPTLAEWTP